LFVISPTNFFGRRYFSGKIYCLDETIFSGKKNIFQPNTFSRLKYFSGKKFFSQNLFQAKRSFSQNILRAKTEYLSGKILFVRKELCTFGRVGREREREGDIMQELALDLTCSGHKMATVQKL
jgi:hypothetical protein